MSERDPLAAIADALSARWPAEHARGYCYAALGDSFTAGTGCQPGENWADRLAARLRARSPRLLYRNLAADGATSAEVLEQVGPALQLEPDLVTVVCGGNDVLRSLRPDIVGYTERLRSMFSGLRAALPAVTLVTATSPTRWSFLGLGPRTSERVEAAIAELNEATREVAASHDVLCLEVADHPGLEDRENFSADGLHPSALGHARAARAFAQLLEPAVGGALGKEVER
jgi:lysophospholipase L1-like esterase